VRRLSYRATAAVVLALGVAACGSAKHSTTAQSTPSTSTPQPASTTVPKPPTTAASTAHPPTTTGTGTGTGTRTTPFPTPAGTPSAPDGLRQTAGYATYELCVSQCSGAVPASVRRPLHIPALGSGGSCPVSAGNGPLKPSPTGLAATSFIGSSWKGARVTWQSSGYQGPILIRGRQVGGQGAIGFGEGHTPYDELQLLGRAMGAPSGQWPSFTRVQAPGCYAYQVDGTSFSELIVFRAT
jgi:hypothetical protein